MLQASVYRKLQATLNHQETVQMHVLVTAATRHEATHEIADAVAADLVQRGIDAESRRLENLHDGLDDFDAVVLGSAVYAGHWLKPAREFARANAAALSSMPVWLFSSGPLGPPGELLPTGEPLDVPELLELTGGRGHRVFAGRLQKRQLGLVERTVARAVHAPEGDFRDWEQIEAFADEIAANLTAGEIADADAVTVAPRPNRRP